VQGAVCAARMTPGFGLVWSCADPSTGKKYRQIDPILLRSSDATAFWRIITARVWNKFDSGAVKANLRWIILNH